MDELEDSISKICNNTKLYIIVDSYTIDVLKNLSIPSNMSGYYYIKYYLEYKLLIKEKRIKVKGIEIINKMTLILGMKKNTILKAMSRAVNKSLNELTADAEEKFFGNCINPITSHMTLKYYLTCVFERMKSDYYLLKIDLDI